MNHISPVNHPESYLTGSTVESMIDRAKELGNEYFAITDHNLLTSVLKGYSYGQKKGVKVIPGVELFFKDEDCEIIKNTPSQRIKYFKIVIHAKDQEAYQALVKLCSENKKIKARIGEEYYNIYNWKDLEHISKFNVTVCTSNIECMVSKHLLVNRPDLSMKYYEKLRNMFGADNFYPTIIPYKQDKYWSTMVELDVGKTVRIPASERIETDRYYKSKAVELTRKNNRHKELKSVVLNGVKFKIKDEYKHIKGASLINDFESMPGGDIQTKANKLIISLANRYGDQNKLLINNYSYYSSKNDKVVQDMKLGEEKRIYQAQYMASIEDVREYMMKELGWVGYSLDILIEHSKAWAENFKDFKLEYSYKLPAPEGDPNKILIDFVKKNGRMKWDDPRYVQQFKEELELLTNNGKLNLIPYLLPIVDIYDFYKTNGFLTGPGRGSAGGFLISYLIGITHVDPIEYGLSSARFLTLDRVQQGNLPDIDCDLESRVPLVGKDGNSGYLFNKYGRKAAQVSTRTLLRIKSAILDANRFVNGGKLEEEIQKLSKSLPTTPQGINDQDFVFGYEDNEGQHIKGLIEISEDLQKYANERDKEWDLVKRALSLSRQHSRHACAYLISDSDIEDTIPVFEVGGVKRVTQPEAKQCEWAGLIKYDFLVVSAIKDINLCLKYINKKNNETNETGYFSHNGEKTFVWALPKDQSVFKDLGDGKTESVFQLNTVSVTPAVKKIKPQSIIDCATITSLWRPGPLDFVDPKTGRNMAEEYIERRYGRSKGDIPILDELLPETYGVLVFQEQVSKVARELGQMSVVDAENVRIAMGKKKIKLLDSLKPSFIKGAAEKTDMDTAEKVWSMMETFARYGFNKSHAVAYSVISYACAFLKHHYPLEWWASVLSNADDKEINEVFYKYVKDMVLPPDINKSTEEMEVDYREEKIRNKLSMIKGLGVKAAEKIIDSRPYTDIKDFIEKKVCGPSMTKKLIHVGVLDSLFTSEKTLLEKITTYEKTVNLVAFEKKLKEYDDKIASETDEKKLKRLHANKEKLQSKGPNPEDVEEFYIGITKKRDFLEKKSIFPTMNLSLDKILKEEAGHNRVKGISCDTVIGINGKDVPIRSGDLLQKIDSINVIQPVTMAVPGYVLDMSEFTYHGGEKKALKLIIDSSGYISEKVIWPDYNDGILKYPKTLKKGCIAYFIYNKKPDKPYTNIWDIIVESESILS